MIVRIILTVIISAVLSILQSTLLVQIMPFDFMPDLALLFFVALSWRYGSMVALIAGFIIGLNHDLLSLAPLGFHAFLYTLSGYLFGRLHNHISPGPLIMPFLAALTATFIKYGGASLLDLVFALHLGTIQTFTLNTLWETLANIALAPLVFFISYQISKLTELRRGGF